MQGRGKFIVGFSGTKVSESVKKLILDFNLAGVILFSRNYSEEKQLKDLIAELKDLKKTVSKDPLIVSVDYEGGFVQRFIELIPDILAPAALAFGGEKNLNIIYSFMAQKLRNLGINLCFAPVLDICTGKNDYIGIRSFGALQKVVDCGLSAVNAFHDSGLSCCAKHFPGLGGTIADSHLTLPHSCFSAEDMEDIHIKPFKAAINAGVDSIMTAHCIYSNLDETNPATFSKLVNNDILRSRMNFKGLLLSDDLDMAGAGGRHNLSLSVDKAITAGVDIMLVCHSTEDLLQYLKNCKFFPEGEPNDRFKLFYNNMNERSDMQVSEIPEDTFQEASKISARAAIEFYEGEKTGSLQNNSPPYDLLLYSERAATSGVENDRKGDFSDLADFKILTGIEKLLEYDFRFLKVLAFLGDLTVKEIELLQEASDRGLVVNRAVLIKNLNNLNFISRFSAEVIFSRGWTHHNKLAIRELLNNC